MELRWVLRCCGYAIKLLGQENAKGGGSYKVRQEIIQWWGVEREEKFTQILSFKCHNEELERWSNG